MKRFLVFMYADYYPSGGRNDERGSFDTLVDAQAFVSTQTWTSGYDILDMELREWVE